MLDPENQTMAYEVRFATHMLDGTLADLRGNRANGTVRVQRPLTTACRHVAHHQ
jgi:hypothetical protein